MKLLAKLNTPFNWFFVIYTVAGFYWMGDYGVPLDELTQWAIGRENARFITGHGNSQIILDNGFFGPVMELINNVSENIIFSKPLGDKVMLRHFNLFVLFLLAIRAFYYLAKKATQVPLVAGLSTVMLALYPVLFSHAHYNSKDTFFLILVIFSIYIFQKYIQYGKWKYLVFTGIIIGMSATVRLSGFFILAAVLLPIMVHQHTLLNVKIKRVFIVFICFVAAFYLFYPFLWIAPVNGLKDLLLYVSSNPWPWNTLMAGQEIVPGHLPWWYLPLWMGVTIPIVSIALFFGGMVALFKKFGVRIGILNFTVLLIFLIPMAYYLLFRPTLYNGWRHMQFLIFPVFFMGIHALNVLLGMKLGQYIAWILGAYSAMVFLLWQPYGYAYFNEAYSVAGKSGTYDQDYWGLSALQGLRWVSEHDSRDTIVISSFTESPQLNSLFLSEKDQKRMHFVTKPGTGDYEVEVRRDRQFANINGQVVYSVCPLKDTLVRVVKIKH